MSSSVPAETDRSGDESRPLLARVTRSVLPGFVRRAYAVKFVLALLLVVLLVAGVGVGSYLQIQEITEADAANTLRSASTVEADVIGGWHSTVESQTRGAATAGIFRTGDDTEIRDHLQESRRMGEPSVTAVHYVDPDAGEVRLSSESTREGTAITAVPTWEQTVERAVGSSTTEGGVVSAERAYEHNGHLHLAFAYPTSGSDGVLIVVADARQVLDRNHETEPTTRVLTTDGYEVDATRQSWPSRLAAVPAFERTLEGESAVGEHEGYVAAFAPVDGTDWIVAVEAPTETLYQASETVGRNVAVLVATTLAALTAVGIVLGRGTVVPLIRLRERTRALERGTFDVDLETDREDEIGRLFTSFGQMRDSLRTQIRETEAAQERAERRRRELATQNERLEQFANTVSHDLRNPLNVADGFRALVEQELETDNPDPEILRDSVDRLASSHERMETIIDDVLALAREGETVEGNLSAVALESLATDAWASIEHAGATLDIVDSRSFAADRSRLRRTFENLFRNAIEHGGPDVTVEVGTTDDGFYVADDGAGISPRIADGVFEYGRTTNDDGTGFGLAIVEAIVTAHGWTIDVDQSATEGTRFVVSGLDVRPEGDGKLDPQDEKPEPQDDAQSESPCDEGPEQE